MAAVSRRITTQARRLCPEAYSHDSRDLRGIWRLNAYLNLLADYVFWGSLAFGLLFVVFALPAKFRSTISPAWVAADVWMGPLIFTFTLGFGHLTWLRRQAIDRRQRQGALHLWVDSLVERKSDGSQLAAAMHTAIAQHKLADLPVYGVVGGKGAGVTTLLQNLCAHQLEGVRSGAMEVSGFAFRLWATAEALFIESTGSHRIENLDQILQDSEWSGLRDFLRSTPLSGLLVVVGADSLRPQDRDHLCTQISRIAKQLEYPARRGLGSRVPAYVILAKADLLGGDPFTGDSWLDWFEHRVGAEQILGWTRASDGRWTNSADTLHTPVTSAEFESGFSILSSQIRSLGYDRLWACDENQPLLSQRREQLANFIESSRSVRGPLREFCERLELMVRTGDRVSRYEASNPRWLLRGIYLVSLNGRGGLVLRDLLRRKILPECSLSPLPQSRGGALPLKSVRLKLALFSGAMLALPFTIFWWLGRNGG